MIYFLIACAMSTAAFGVYQENLILCLLAAALFSALAAMLLKGLFQRAAVIATSILLSWTAMEAALFLMEPSPEGNVAFLDPASEAEIPYWQTSDAYGVLPSSGVHRAMKTTKTGDVIYDVVYTTDADGFRVMATDSGTPGGGVVFLGGSTTFGEGLNDDQTLPHHFSLRQPGRNVRNLAVSGWGLHQAFSLWKNAVKETGTTVIVQTAPWHADRVACIPQFSGLSPRYDDVDGDLVETGRCRTWFENKILAKLMIKSGLLQRLYDALNLQHHQQKMELYLAMLGAMNDLAVERGQCLIVSFIKAEDDYLSGTNYTNALIMQTLTDGGIIVVDTTLASNRAELNSQYFIPGDGHPTNEANEQRAAILASTLTQCDQQRLAMQPSE